jgi:hypothetical protein
MNALRAVARLLVVGALSITFVACSSTQAPTKWTLWYIPDEPKPGIVVPHTKACNSYVLASAPDQLTYVVAVVDGWTGARRPQGNTASMHAGESYTGPLELGANTLHDESNGYDLRVDVVYNVAAYLPAKARADADCGPPAHPTGRTILTTPR